MATWIRMAIGTDPATDFTYLNLDHVRQAQVFPTISGPAGFGIELGGVDGSDFGSVYGRWDTVSEANAALQLLIRGIDLSATTGEEI